MGVKIGEIIFRKMAHWKEKIFNYVDSWNKFINCNAEKEMK